MTASSSPSSKGILLLLVAAPLLALFVVGVAIIVGQAAGRHPFWPTPDLNLSEFAAVTATADVMRLIQDGADPNGSYHVRPEFLEEWRSSGIDSADHVYNDAGLPLFAADGMYRPLRVAVIVRQPSLVGMLIRQGATLEGAERTAAICFADLNHETAIVTALLATGDGSDPRGSCPNVAER
ncbi:MAG TPA: hypothetical protein VGJ78_20820 [Vicinamibacterales bacterium]|jgi:hypothetical protein